MDYLDFWFNPLPVTEPANPPGSVAPIGPVHRPPKVIAAENLPLQTDNSRHFGSMGNSGMKLWHFGSMKNLQISNFWVTSCVCVAALGESESYDTAQGPGTILVALHIYTKKRALRAR